MDLKKAIVIKNEFTNTAGGSRGTRGSTPGKFVIDYMSREDATETLAPVEVNDSGLVFYATRYMARSDATEKMKLLGPRGSAKELKHEFSELEYLSGRGFGRRHISLSGKQLVDTSKAIQQAFDDGHTVQKIVLSFTDEYLHETGVVDKSFEFAGKGSYRGQLDQLKLRQAITSGINKMTRDGGYKDPEWVGVIQVDTSHVHCHLALVDKEFSNHRTVYDGYDRGKIHESEKSALRFGINHALIDMKAMKSFHHQVDLDRRNVVSFVKDYAYDEISHNTTLQLLVASLPKNKNLWRYSTNNEKMARSNELAESIVTRLFKEQPDKSGYSKTLRSILDYSNQRQSDDGLSLNERQKLIDNGKKLIIERSVNGLYSFLSDEVSESDLEIQTPMIDVQSSSDNELKSMLSRKEPDSFDAVGFELRIRGFNNRRDTHMKEAIEYKQALDQFDEQYDTGQVALDALVMRRFYEEELDYNMKLVDKYRYFFKFNHRFDLKNVEEMTPQYDQLTTQFDSIHKKEQLIFDFEDDNLLSKLNLPSDIDLVENISLIDSRIYDKYGVLSGSRVYDDSYRSVIIDEIVNDKQDYTKALRNYTFECFVKGVATAREWNAVSSGYENMDVMEYHEQMKYGSGEFVAPFAPKTRAEGIDKNHFNSVKALDLHHLGIDFYGRIDHSISSSNAQKFVEAYRLRDVIVEDANNYLTKTNQPLSVIKKAKLDISDMKDAAEVAADKHEIKVIAPDVGDFMDNRNYKTIRLDDRRDLLKEIQASLDADQIAMDASQSIIMQNPDFREFD